MNSRKVIHGDRWVFNIGVAFRCKEDEVLQPNKAIQNEGSVTGAHRDRVGRRQLANHGTLFLDEVGEIPMDLQGKLLRALQESEFERVGDEKTTKVDVRIIAATNRNLAEEIRQRRFREDLYYRLSVFLVEVPPLRERIEDIPPIAQHFLDHLCQQLGRKQLNLTQAHINRLQNH